MPLLDRHVAFVEALRTAGLPVSLAEDLDAVRALDALGLADRESVRAALSATLVKRQSHRTRFDAVFDLFFPPLVGEGRPAGDDDGEQGAADRDARGASAGNEGRLGGLREELVEAMAAGAGAGAGTGEDRRVTTNRRVTTLAREAVELFGALPDRPEGMSRWSSYNTLRALNPDTLVLRLAQALMRGDAGGEPRSEDLALRAATLRVDRLRRLVEGDVRRRIAEDKQPDHVARTTLRPTLENLDFTHARQDEVDEMRRQIYPLARRLAARLAKERHHRRRGPLDFRRTVRASISTGGVPVTTHHRPRRPHRPELVVLCDVSGSVAGFASFTLLLVYALQEQFGAVRAFTFVDDVHEVTGDFVPGSDLEETLSRLAASARHASMWGRTNYGRAFARFQEEHPDALGPKTSLLVLGDARSNYSDPRLDVARRLVDATRHTWWLNPEPRRQWDTGDSAARQYAEVMPMVECRNLAQLTAFVHDLL